MKQLTILLLAIITTGIFAQEYDNLAKTPPMGWNSWNLFEGDVSEDLLKGIADAMVETGMLDAGYEYIIIDTPPVGLIADSLLLMKYASQVLIVTRNNYTKKQVLLNAIASLDSNRINNFEVIVNDLELEKSAYSGYKRYYHEE